jgi:hypothetical protein
MLLTTSSRKGLPSVVLGSFVKPPSIFQDEPVGDDAAIPAAKGKGATFEHEDDSDSAAASIGGLLADDTSASPRSLLRALGLINRTIMAIGAALPDLEEWKSRDVGLMRNIMGAVLAAARVDLGS